MDSCIFLSNVDFQILEKITSEIKSVDFSNAMSEPNIPKNRYKDKIPCEFAHEDSSLVNINHQVCGQDMNK